MAYVGTPLEVEGRVVVAADPWRVWNAVVDWPRQGEWMIGTRVRGGHGPGAAVTGRTGLGPIGFTDTMRIVEWDPPRRCVVRHTGRLVRGLGVFEVTPRQQATEFRWAEDLQVPLPGVAAELVRLVVTPLARWGLEASLRRFARRLPDGDAPPR